MYEFINLTCFCGLVAGAIVLRRPHYRPLWVFLLLPVLILLTVSGRWLYTNAAPVMPALQSYWLPIHVSVVSLGSGVFMVAGVASILFLLRTSRLGEPNAPGQSGPARAAAARRADARSDRLPNHDLRVPGLRFRGDLRRDLGRGGLGPVLGLGPQGDGGLHRLGGLRRVSARPVDGRMAGPQSGLDQRGRLRGHGLQPVLRQPGRPSACIPTPEWDKSRSEAFSWRCDMFDRKDCSSTSEPECRNEGVSHVSDHPPYDPNDGRRGEHPTTELPPHAPPPPPPPALLPVYWFPYRVGDLPGPCFGVGRWSCRNQLPPTPPQVQQT